MTLFVSLFASVYDIRAKEEGALQQNQPAHDSLHLECDLSLGQSFTVINKERKTKVLISQFPCILKFSLRLKSTGQRRLLVCGSPGTAD